jgi:nitroreductase
MEKLAEVNHSIHDLLQKRWSPRAFSSRPVESEKLLSLLEAARWSPSGANEQPWSFVVATRTDHAAHEKFVDFLAGTNRLWAANAPILMLTVAKQNRQSGAPNRHAGYDVGQAVAHMTVQATALGLVVHQMGGFDVDKARQHLAIPEGYEPMTVIAIGYQGSLNDLPKELQDRELSGRSRKPITDFVFSGSWNQPLTHSDKEAVAGV